MKSFPGLGIQAPHILLPNASIDLSKWAVVACDQYTSQPEYWKAVEECVDGHPSTYFMILPEAYLGSSKENEHSAHVLPTMEEYLAQDIFQQVDGFILVERWFDGKTRYGLMAALDLKAYDFSPDSQSLIRATEGTIVDRLPPRIAIREKAMLEIPHILVLIDDPAKTVIEPLVGKAERSNLVYDFDLMQNSGHLTGYKVEPAHHDQITAALEKLMSTEIQRQKYGTTDDTPPMLYAMGDGNHSLATAKAIWDKNKANLPADHPARFALVEIVNLHDSGIEFEAIHRLLKKPIGGLMDQCQNYFPGCAVEYVPDFETLTHMVDHPAGGKQSFGVFDQHAYCVITINKPRHTLAVGNVQSWLDDMTTQKMIEEVDYIHGAETIHALGGSEDSAGVYLPAMPKDALFRSVIKDGPLPRKTFSMGEAHQKRFYLECRRIKQDA